jgi:hypothetical protein
VSRCSVASWSPGPAGLRAVQAHVTSESSANLGRSVGKKAQQRRLPNVRYRTHSARPKTCADPSKTPHGWPCRQHTRQSGPPPNFLILEHAFGSRRIREFSDACSVRSATYAGGRASLGQSNYICKFNSLWGRFNRPTVADLGAERNFCRDLFAATVIPCRRRDCRRRPGREQCRHRRRGDRQSRRSKV